MISGGSRRIGSDIGLALGADGADVIPFARVDRDSMERTLRKKLIKIGAEVVAHSRYVFFQMAEVAVPRWLFRAILERIGRLRPREPVPG